MKIGDLVRCTYQGHDVVCILKEDVAASFGSHWRVIYPDGKVLIVHKNYIRVII